MLLAGIAFVPWSASADITLTNASGTTLAAALAQGGYIRLVFTYGSNSTGLVFSNVSLGLPAESVVQADTTLDAGSNTVTLFPLLSTGQASFRLFSVAPGLSLTLLNLTLASGSNSVGGAISNAGTLVASNCVFKNNFAGGTSGVNGNNGADSSWGNGKNGGNGGSGAGAVGGAIYNLGTASVAWCQFLTNTVMGGSGGNGGNGGNGGASGGNGGNGGGQEPGKGGRSIAKGFWS